MENLMHVGGDLLVAPDLCVAQDTDRLLPVCCFSE